MPEFEIIRKVNEGLTALKPIIEEKLRALEKKDETLTQLYAVENPQIGESLVCKAVLAIDREVCMLELRITLTTSGVLGFMVAGDDAKSAANIKKQVEKEVRAMLAFLKDRVAYVLPNYSAIRYGTASVSDPAKNQTAP